MDHAAIRPGQVRVGSCHYSGSNRTDPSYPGFTPIVCLTQSSAYGMIGPYVLTIPVRFKKTIFPSSLPTKGITKEGVDDYEEIDCIFECYYQACKVYRLVPAVSEIRSRFDTTVIWHWPSQVHVKTIEQNGVKGDQITSEYMWWRKALMTNPEPVRYPVGRGNMSSCLYSLAQTDDGGIDPTPLDYVSARKQIYLKHYARAVKKHPVFQDLKRRLAAGENLLIIEVDCCQERSLSYYKEKYGVGDDFIENGTMIVNPRNLEIMLNDTKERYGHGYVAAGCLLDIY